jgi:hypothetical protein
MCASLLPLSHHTSSLGTSRVGRILTFPYLWVNSAFITILDNSPPLVSPLLPLSTLRSFSMWCNPLTPFPSVPLIGRAPPRTIVCHPQASHRRQLGRDHLHPFFHYVWLSDDPVQLPGQANKHHIHFFDSAPPLNLVAPPPLIVGHLQRELV